MKQSLIILSVLLLVQVTFGAYCHGKPGNYYTNEQPIWSGEPVLLGKHKYGQLFQIGSGDNAMKLLHAYGNMYQMGLAHGVLLKEELNRFMPELWGYM